MDAPAPHPGHQPRSSGGFRRALGWSRPYLLTLLALAGGFLAAQAGLPARVSRAEAQIAQLQQGQDRFHVLLTEIKESLEASHRLQCIEAREQALAGNRALQLQLDAAKIDCATLLGNRVRS